MTADKYYNKIGQFFLSGIICLHITFYATAQLGAPTINKYGLQVTSDIKHYQNSIKKDSTRQMVALYQWLKPLIADFTYATTNNFTKQILYKNPEAYLRKEAATALKKVQDTLHTLGLDIKILDAYRPYNVTEKMWLIVPDERYAANPATGSGHNRGIAVDVTLIDKATGKELQMPTAYDDFSDSAHHDFMQLNAIKIQNRATLKQVMEQYGFKALKTEWWHYSIPNTAKYEILNFNFEEMKKLTQ